MMHVINGRLSTRLGYMATFYFFMAIDVLLQYARASTVQPKVTVTTTIKVPVDPPDPVDEESGGTSNFESGLYTGIILIGVFSLPLTICLRICWSRRIQRNNARAVNRRRDHIEHRLVDGRQGVYTVEQVVITPPSYEQCISEPGPDQPPPYDPPPEYTDLPDIKSNTSHSSIDS